MPPHVSYNIYYLSIHNDVGLRKIQSMIKQKVIIHQGPITTIGTSSSHNKNFLQNSNCSQQSCPASLQIIPCSQAEIQNQNRLLKIIFT